MLIQNDAYFSLSGRLLKHTASGIVNIGYPIQDAINFMNFRSTVIRAIPDGVEIDDGNKAYRYQENKGWSEIPVA